MNDKFTEIEIKSLQDNVFKLLDNDWMLITAGKKDACNLMTASWGTFGILWNKPVATIFIRPHRHTLKFVQENSFFTLSFFPHHCRHILNYCGQHSGQTVDKIKETGLIPMETETGNVGFEQARLIIECKKLYSDELKSDKFINLELMHKHYPSKDYHQIFIGEILHCFVSKESEK
jgi:flavin reductase (DIM6/NTAB) family NADH-FMN oxidoreductase RutF